MYKLFKIALETATPDGRLYDIPEGYRIDHTLVANGEFVVLVLEQYARPERETRPAWASPTWGETGIVSTNGTAWVSSGVSNGGSGMITTSAAIDTPDIPTRIGD